jgi:hypothetical protein
MLTGGMSRGVSEIMVTDNTIQFDNMSGTPCDGMA